MPCDPKKIFTDLQVVGAVLTYTELWVAGGNKALFTANTNAFIMIYNFQYKSVNYFNIFTRDILGNLVSAEIHIGEYTTDGQMVDDTTLIERINY